MFKTRVDHSLQDPGASHLTSMRFWSLKGSNNPYRKDLCYQSHMHGCHPSARHKRTRWARAGPDVTAQRETVDERDSDVGFHVLPSQELTESRCQQLRHQNNSCKGCALGCRDCHCSELVSTPQVPGPTTEETSRRL